MMQQPGSPGAFWCPLPDFLHSSLVSFGGLLYKTVSTDVIGRALLPFELTSSECLQQPPKDSIYKPWNSPLFFSALVRKPQRFLSHFCICPCPSTPEFYSLLVPQTCDAISSHCRQSYQSSPLRDLPQNSTSKLLGHSLTHSQSVSQSVSTTRAQSIFAHTRGHDSRLE
ncbi:hypothetical protein HZ326_8689 [Fusarium oxysporum f. sp. albedinis]|nr:hypothetical protein HZ326_8689 [Fusarium oxysporum f. sp. albedinis]